MELEAFFCRIHHLCEQSNCPVTTRLSSVAIKSCHRSSFPPHFAPFSKHSPSSSPRIESQINLYLKFNKQFDFEDDMQRTKANFAGCVFWNLKHLSKKGDRVHKSWNATRDVSHHSGGEAKRSVLLRRLNSSQWWFYSYRRHTLIITHRSGAALTLPTLSVLLLLSYARISQLSCALLPNGTTFMSSRQ